MKKIVSISLALFATISLVVLPARAETSIHPGFFFDITNECRTPTVDLGVGDEICLLEMGNSTVTRQILDGTLAPGQKKIVMACAGKDGEGLVIFAPGPGLGIDAIVMNVKRNQVVSVPKTFCRR